MSSFNNSDNIFAYLKTPFLKLDEHTIFVYGFFLMLIFTLGIYLFFYLLIK
jgi:hypothetical protein